MSCSESDHAQPGPSRWEGPGPAAPPPAVTKAYDLLLWLVRHVANFPRSHRFVLGERIETTMLNVLMALVEASHKREKVALLEQANGELDKLRFLVRLGKDLGFTSVSQYEHASNAVFELGQQVGGWLRHQRRA